MELRELASYKMRVVESYFKDQVVFQVDANNGKLLPLVSLQMDKKFAMAVIAMQEFCKLALEVEMPKEQKCICHEGDFGHCDCGARANNEVLRQCRAIVARKLVELPEVVRRASYEWAIYGRDLDLSKNEYITKAIQDHFKGVV